MAELSYKEEREKMAELARRLVSEGIMAPIGGQIACRVRRDVLIVKAKGQSMLKPEDYCVVVGEELPENVSKMFPVHKFIFDNQKEDVNVILHVRVPYVDVLASFLKGQSLISTEVLWALGSELPVEAFPEDKPIKNFSDLVDIFKRLSDKHLVKAKKKGFIVEHFGIWLVAPDLDKAYAYVKAIEHIAKVSVYKKIIGTSSTMPSNLKIFLETVTR